MSLLTQNIVLKLNSVWYPIHTESPQTAFVDLSKGSTRALDIQYNVDELGDYDLTSEPSAIIPTSWEDWINLDVRYFDSFVSTGKRKIRVPTIVVCNTYNQIPHKILKLNRNGIWARDKGIDQYTGKPLIYSDASIDHVIPASRGGRNSWDNCVLTHKSINWKKADHTPEEVGLKLIKQPRAPMPVPISALITEVRHRDWALFLK